MASGIKKYSLKGQKYFDALFGSGERVYSDGITLISRKISEGHRANERKIAFCIAKRQGNAVFRNRLKRVSREAVISFFPDVKPCHTAILPTRRFESMKPVDREKSMRKAFKRAGLL